MKTQCLPLVVVVVWQSIYDPGQTQERMEVKGLSFYHHSLLCCPDQMLAVTKLSKHLVSSFKTVRPIIPRGARCVGHHKIIWSAVCSPAPRSHFAEEARHYLCMDEPNTQAIEYHPNCSGQTYSKRPCVDLRNVDTER